MSDSTTAPTTGKATSIRATTTTELTDAERTLLRDLRGELLLAMGDPDPQSAHARLVKVFEMVGGIAEVLKQRQLTRDVLLQQQPRLF